MYCKKCGTEQKEGQKFCAKCGTPYLDENGKPYARGIQKNLQNMEKSLMDTMGELADQGVKLGDASIEYLKKAKDSMKEKAASASPGPEQTSQNSTTPPPISTISPSTPPPFNFGVQGQGYGNTISTIYNSKIKFFEDFLLRLGNKYLTGNVLRIICIFFFLFFFIDEIHKHFFYNSNEYARILTYLFATIEHTLWLVFFIALMIVVYKKIKRMPLIPLLIAFTVIVMSFDLLEFIITFLFGTESLGSSENMALFQAVGEGLMQITYFILLYIVAFQLLYTNLRKIGISLILANIAFFYFNIVSTSYNILFNEDFPHKGLYHDIVLVLIPISGIAKLFVIFYVLWLLPSQLDEVRDKS